MKTTNKKSQLKIDAGGINKILNQSKRVSDRIYIYKVMDMNIVFCIVEGNDILKPEKVLFLLYARELKKLVIRDILL